MKPLPCFPEPASASRKKGRDTSRPVTWTVIKGVGVVPFIRGKRRTDSVGYEVSGVLRRDVMKYVEQRDNVPLSGSSNGISGFGTAGTAKSHIYCMRRGGGHNNMNTCKIWCSPIVQYSCKKNWTLEKLMTFFLCRKTKDLTQLGRTFFPILVPRAVCLFICCECCPLITCVLQK